MAETHESALEIAADWVDRLDELTADEKHALAAWLDASPDHARAFATMHRLIHDSALLEAANEYGEPDATATRMAEPASVHRRPGAARRRWTNEGRPEPLATRRGVLAASLAAALALPVALFWMRHQEPDATDDSARRHYASAIGQQKRYGLPDGSTLLLDAGSSVSTHFAPKRRSLDLDRGGARFDVAHDADRPFEVNTPMARMVALGTSFTVDRLTAASELRVFEGRVRLDVPDRGSIVVAAGHWALVSEAGVQLGRFDPGGYGGWQSHWLDAESMRLDFAVDRLSRYSSMPIRLADSRLAERSFSGRFRLDQPDQSLTLICGLFQLVPVRRDGAIYLERDRSGT